MNFDFSTTPRRQGRSRRSSTYYDSVSPYAPPEPDGTTVPAEMRALQAHVSNLDRRLDQILQAVLKQSSKKTLAAPTSFADEDDPDDDPDEASLKTRLMELDPGPLRPQGDLNEIRTAMSQGNPSTETKIAPSTAPTSRIPGKQDTRTTASEPQRRNLFPEEEEATYAQVTKRKSKKKSTLILEPDGELTDDEDATRTDGTASHYFRNKNDEATRRRVASVSMHYVIPAGGVTRRNAEQDPLVMWLSKKIEGPYSGKPDRLMKCTAIKLKSDSTSDFFVLYHSLQSHIESAEYHRELLPDLQYISPICDLRHSPIRADDMPFVGKGLGEQMDQQFWENEHETMNRFLCAMLVTNDVFESTAPNASRILKTHQIKGDGFAVLNDLIRQHHPSHQHSLAPSWSIISETHPKMNAAHKVSDLLANFSDYQAAFALWLQHLSLYHESDSFRPASTAIKFVEGLQASMRLLVSSEYNGLIQHKSSYSFLTTEKELPQELMLSRICSTITNYLTHQQANTDTRITSLSSVPDMQTKPRRVSMIESMPMHGQLSYFPEETLHTLAEQIGDEVFFHDTVAAFQRFNQRHPGGQRGGPPTKECVLCKHAPCGRHHPADECCICFGQRHPISGCWHVIGLPDRKAEAVKGFKQLFEMKGGPWAGKDAADGGPPWRRVQPPTVHAIHDTMTVVQQVVTDNEDAVEEITRDGLGYESSFVHQFLVNSKDKGPRVSAINDSSIASMLPSDAHDIDIDLPSFLSTADSKLSLYAWMNVDSGATLPVTHRPGELHQRVHTNMFCGTAAAGGETQIDGIGTLKLDFVNHKKVKHHVSITLPGSAEITGFHRRSLSLAAIKGIGYNCGHEYLASGNQLWIEIEGTKHNFPLVTKDKQDFILVEIHKPQSPIMQGQVSRIDLANHLKGESIYYLLHLRLGCASRRVMEAVIESKLIKGLPTDMKIPEVMKCPICERENAKALNKAAPSNIFFLPLGVRFHADFGFFRIQSLRGFSCFLIITEAVTSYTWVFCRRSKQPPVRLLLWFVTYARKRLGASFAQLRTDNGGELWGCHELRNSLLEQHVAMEPTGAGNSAANGKAERSIGIVCRTAQSLLYASGMEPEYWCFALTHATFLKNIKPSADNPSSHKQLYKVDPDYNSLVIWGSAVYVINRRLTRARPDSATILGRFLGFHGTTSLMCYVNETTKEICYAHHTEVDELDLTKLPGDRSPAAQFLSGLDPDPNAQDRLRTAINDLEPTLSPWLTEHLVQYHIPDTPPGSRIGIISEFENAIGRVKITGLVPGSLAVLHLPHTVIGLYVLTVNGISIRNASDMDQIIDDIHEREDETRHLLFTGLSFLLGKSPYTMDDSQKHVPSDTLDFSATDHATARAVWSLYETSLLTNEAPDELTMQHRVALINLLNLPTSVASLHWKQALQDTANKGKWIEGFHKHLDSCYNIGTYSCPRVPPPTAIVLPAVIVLKMVVNAVKQVSAHKVRICVHGGHQQQGRDYDESYAATVLAQSLKVCMAVGCNLGWKAYHFDVHNAFQSTPDPGNETTGQKAWLRVNQEWLEYIKLKQPVMWEELEVTLRTRKVNELAVEMHMFVQGRTDASRKWQLLVEICITEELKFIPNRADSCVYVGTVDNEPAIMCRATDDFLVFCDKDSTYDKIVAIFEKQWTVHKLGLATMFFGLRIIQSDECVTIDQEEKVRATVAQVFGPKYHLQTAGKGYSIPMATGTEHQEELLRCDPFPPEALAHAQTHKFGFVYRTVLGSCMHIAIWTRLDILTAATILSQYQSRIGNSHFDALKRLVGYMRLHPDLPLVFKRTTRTKLNQICAIEIRLNQADPAQSELLDPDLFHVMSVDTRDHPTRRPFLRPDSLDDVSQTVLIGKPPWTEAYADSNLPGGIFERLSHTGGSIEMSGTCVISICKKQDTLPMNSTEAEIAAGVHVGKVVRWTDLFMTDLGVPLTGPVPIAEDNAATRLIAHAGKVTRNVRHIAIQTRALQDLVTYKYAVFRAVGTADNHADHFTKALPYPAFRTFCGQMLGLRYLTPQHNSLLAALKSKAFDDD